MQVNLRGVHCLHVPRCLRHILLWCNGLARTSDGSDRVLCSGSHLKFRFMFSTGRRGLPPLDGLAVGVPSARVGLMLVIRSGQMYAQSRIWIRHARRVGLATENRCSHYGLGSHWHYGCLAGKGARQWPRARELHVSRSIQPWSTPCGATLAGRSSRSMGSGSRSARAGRAVPDRVAVFVCDGRERGHSSSARRSCAPALAPTAPTQQSSPGRWTRSRRSLHVRKLPSRYNHAVLALLATMILESGKFDDINFYEIWRLRGRASI